MARLCVPAIADYCLVADVAADGEVEVATAHADPRRERLLQELTRQPLADGQSLAVAALTSGKPQALFDISDSDLRAAARDRNQLKVLRALGPRSSIFLPLVGRERILGVVGLAYAESGRRYTPEDIQFGIEFAQRAALAVENAYLYSATKLAEGATRRQASHFQLLSEASNALVNAGLDLKGVLDTVARRVAELIGDVFVIGLLTDDKQFLEAISVAHPRARQRALLRRLQRIPRPAQEGLSGVVLERNEPLLIERTSREEMLPRTAGRYRAYIERYGVSSVLAVPLRTAEGPIGVLFLGRDEGGEPYNLDDQALLVELAARTAQAIENARLYQAEQNARRSAEHAAQRTERLQRLTAMLASAQDLDEVARIAVRENLDALGAQKAAVALLDESGDTMSIVSSVGYSRTLIKKWQRLELSASSPMTDAIRNLTPVALASAKDVSKAYPHIGPEKRTRNEGFLAIPLINEGRATGVLGLSFAERRNFDQKDRDYVMAIGGQCAQAFERVRLYQAQQAARRAVEHAFRRNEALQSVTSALANLVSPADVAEVAVREGRAALDADAAWLAVIDAEKQALRVVGRAGYDEDKVQRWDTVPLSSATPVTDAARTGRPFWYSHFSEVYARYPTLRNQMDETYEALAGIPLVGTSGCLGVLCLSFRDRREFSPPDRAFISSLAQQCAQAFERTQLHEETQRYNQRLQAFAEATAEFAEAALDVERVADTVAKRIGELIGDSCVVRLLEADASSYRQAAVYHPDPKRRAALLSLESRNQPADEGISRRIAETGRPVLMAEIGAEELSAMAEPYRSFFRKHPIYSLLAAPLHSRGRLIGTVGVSRMSRGRPYGLDDQRFLVELADRAALAIDNAQLFERSEQALIARNRFLSMASHELKTPITSIKGYTQLLLRRALKARDEDSADVLDVVDSEADRMTRLINELLDISRIERGKLEFRFEPVDLAQTLRESLSNVAMTARDFSFNLQEEATGVVIRGDRMRIEQVMTNLLTNAVKYSRDRREVDVRVYSRDGHAGFDVTDYGIGVPLQQQTDVFELFFRGSNLVGESHSGMGLGLFICNAIVREHGGTIGLVSREGEGSTFTVTLPLAVRPGRARSQPRSIARPAASRKRSRRSR